MESNKHEVIESIRGIYSSEPCENIKGTNGVNHSSSMNKGGSMVEGV